MEQQDEAERPEDIALNPHFQEDERALLHALLQATDYGILMSGLDRQDIVANRRLGELFHLTPQHLVETQPEDSRAIARNRLRNPHDFDDLLEQIYAHPEMSYEDELELLNGPPNFVRRFTGPVRNSIGNPIGRLWTFLDISENKRLQEEVQSQLRARTEESAATSGALKAMNDLCRMASQFRTIEELLTAIVKLVRSLLEYESVAVLLQSPSGQEWIGAGCNPFHNNKKILLRCHDDPSLMRIVERSAETKVVFTRLASHRGTIARLLKCGDLDVAPLCSQGRCLGLLLLANPKAEGNDLHRYHETHLQAFVEQIALALETHRLQAELQSALESLKSTQKRIVEMEKLRTAGVLAASIAHDIRNILSTMQLEIEMQPGAASESVCDQLNRFSALTHRLLAFSRPNVLETRPTSMDEIIRRIVPLVAGQAQISGVEIVLQLSGGQRVAADGSQLEHLFVNLCLNAIQAMTDRGGVLTISDRSDRHWHTITVEDTGCGIRAEAIKQLFDPFFTTRSTGLGLGLFSCKRIVEEHGGQLTVQSEAGKGACFTVMLPAIIQEA